MTPTCGWVAYPSLAEHDMLRSMASELLCDCWSKGPMESTFHGFCIRITPLILQEGKPVVVRFELTNKGSVLERFVTKRIDA